MAELTVDDLHLTYGDNPILKGVSLTLNRGEVVSLLGPSGSGKTTLLRAVAGLETPHQGTIRIGDKVVFDGAARADIPAEGRNLGLVFQSYALWPHKTVHDNVAYGLKLRKIPGAEIGTRVKTALEQLSLGHLGERFPHQLSGGQKARVGIARAIALKPDLIILDEPTAALDVSVQAVVLNLLQDLKDSLGMSYLFVSHDLNVVRLLCDRVIVMQTGQIVEHGPTERVMGAPEAAYTRDLLAAIPHPPV